MKLLKIAAGLIVVIVVIVAITGGSEDPPAAGPGPDAQAANDDEPEPEPEREARNLDGTYNLRCDYLLGDFGESGDPSQGYRFVGGGTVRNTGNVGIVVRVTHTWEQLGQAPVRDVQTVRLQPGGRERVRVTLPATQDQIDSHQSADGECTARARIVEDFGRPPLQD